MLSVQKLGFYNIVEFEAREMSDHEEAKSESLIEKISEKISDKIHGHDSSSSSSDSDNDDTASLKNKIFRIFGRQKPVHTVFGGGKRMLILYGVFHICYLLTSIILFFVNFLK